MSRVDEMAQAFAYLQERKRMTTPPNVHGGAASVRTGQAPAGIPGSQAPPLRITPVDCQIEWSHNEDGELTLMDLVRQAKKAKEAGDMKRCRLYLTAVLIRFERKQADARRQLAGETP